MRAGVRCDALMDCFDMFAQAFNTDELFITLLASMFQPVQFVGLHVVIHVACLVSLVVTELARMLQFNFMGSFRMPEQINF